jgi:hypothetical protein
LVAGEVIFIGEAFGEFDEVHAPKFSGEEVATPLDC